MARTTQGTLDPDLESLTDEDLRELLSRVRQTLQTRVKGRLEAFQQMARDAGLEVTIGRVGEADGRRRESQRRPAPAKYRNPDNPSETWSGRGREPKWLSEKTAAGASREQFAI